MPPASRQKNFTVNYQLKIGHLKSEEQFGSKDRWSFKKSFMIAILEKYELNLQRDQDNEWANYTVCREVYNFQTPPPLILLALNPN